MQFEKQFLSALDEDTSLKLTRQVLNEIRELEEKKQW